MGKGTSDSEARRILQEIVSRKGGKVWVARRIGRRLAYIDGMKAGKELFLPPVILYDDGKIVVFGEGLEGDEWVVKKLQELAEKLEGIE